MSQKQKAKTITPEEYISQYIHDLPFDYKFQGSPIQVYELSSLSKHLKTPTPLLKPNFNFLVHLTEGKFSQQIGPETMHIKAPAILYIGQGYLTALKRISSPISGYFILIENKALSKLLSNNELLKLFNIDPVLKLTSNSSSWLEKLNSLLHIELTSEQPDREVSVSLFQTVLHKILALAGKNKSLTASQVIAMRFKELAYKSYLKHRDVGYYAKELGVSENYLNRCVKSVSGKSVKETVLEICVLQSQLLLQDLSKDVAGVANDLNFEDPSYFGRLFKKLTNQTPSEYRKLFMHDKSE